MTFNQTFRKRIAQKGLWPLIGPLVERTEDASGRADLPEFVRLLDQTVPPEVRLSVMEELGCCKSDRRPQRAFRKQFGALPLPERVARMSELRSPYQAPTQSNEDGTLTVFWALSEGGRFCCPCSCKMMRTVKATQTTPVSPTFCACCGGHVKALWETALGVRLRLKQVVSSALTSDFRKRCEFLFDVIEKEKP